MTITFDEAQLESDIAARIKGVQPAVERSMAVAFESCVSANFGFIGFERPNDWAPLSHNYALKVGRTVATLELTGAMKGNLITEDNKVNLIANSAANYALDHEFGLPWKGLPRRSVIPIVDGVCLPKTYAQVVEAAQETINYKIA